MKKNSGGSKILNDILNSFFRSGRSHLFYNKSNILIKHLGLQFYSLMKDFMTKHFSSPDHKRRGSQKSTISSDERLLLAKELKQKTRHTKRRTIDCRKKMTMKRRTGHELHKYS